MGRLLANTTAKRSISRWLIGRNRKNPVLPREILLFPHHARFVICFVLIFSLLSARRVTREYRRRQTTTTKLAFFVYFRNFVAFMMKEVLLASGRWAIQVNGVYLALTIYQAFVANLRLGARRNKGRGPRPQCTS